MKTVAWTCPFAVSLILAANISCAFAGDNDPFGQEFACYRSLSHFAYAKDFRQAGLPSSNMQPISNDSGIRPPEMVGLEEKSADGKSLILHFFTGSGEFDKTIPYPSGKRIYEACISGISYPGGTGSVIYSSFSDDQGGGRLGAMSTYAEENPCTAWPDQTNTGLVAHQVGSNLQAQSTALLDGEIAIMIQSVHHNWETNSNFANRRRSLERRGIMILPVRPLSMKADDKAADDKAANDPKDGALSPEANKRALKGCADALKGPEFESLRTLVAQQISKFDKPAPVGGTDTTGSQKGPSTSGAAVTPP